MPESLATIVSIKGQVCCPARVALEAVDGTFAGGAEPTTPTPARARGRFPRRRLEFHDVDRRRSWRSPDPARVSRRR